MPLSLSAWVSKMGMAATLILGAAIGSQVRKKQQRDSVPTNVTQRYVHHRVKAANVKTGTNGNTHILEIYQRLQELSPFHITGSPTTIFYMERGKEMCQQYFHVNGILKKNSELWVKEWLKNIEWVDGEDYWIKLPTLKPGAPSYTNTLLAALMALWFLSCNKDFCKGNFTTDEKLMVTLKKILNEGDYAVHPLVLRIIANIIAVADDYQPIYQSGLVEVLESFKNHNTPDVFLPAWRGLLNLKPEKSKATGQKVIYQEGLYPYIMPDLKQAGNAELDIILVHGIKGGADITWRQHDNESIKPLLTQEQRRDILSKKFEGEIDNFYTPCWPLDWLVPSMDMPVRVLAVDYEANWCHWGNDYPEEAIGTFARHSKKIASHLDAAGVGDRPIVWITHSMGGLIVKNMLIKDLESSRLPPSASYSANNNLSSQTLGIVFYSVPHYGSPIASSVSKGLLRYVLRPSTEVFEMREDSPILQELHKSFLHLVDDQGIAVLTLNESNPVRRKALNFLLVPPKHGSSDVGEFHEVDACHIDICKPLNRDAESYEKVLTFLQDITRRL